MIEKWARVALRTILYHFCIIACIHLEEGVINISN